MTDQPGPGARGLDARSTDVPRGGGVPAWLAASITHCATCGAALELREVAGEERPRLVCADHGHITYVNPRLVVTTLPITEAGEVVLLRRGFEPGRGSWAQPGGFLEVDETPSEGAIRETEEEIGLVVTTGDIVGLYARLEAAVIVLAYEARIDGRRAADDRPRRSRSGRSPRTRSRGPRSRSGRRGGRSSTGLRAVTRTCSRRSIPPVADARPPHAAGAAPISTARRRLPIWWPDRS